MVSVPVVPFRRISFPYDKGRRKKKSFSTVKIPFGCQTNSFSLLILNPGNKACLQESVPIHISSSKVNSAVKQRKNTKEKSFYFL